MISICIPVYNNYVYPLVRRLVNQMKNITAEEFEVVCIDNHSSGYYANQNKGVAELATYLTVGKTIGMNQLRNLFIGHSKGDYLLYVDSAASVPDLYLKNYIKQVAKNPAVVVGGLLFDEGLADTEHALRYQYAVSIECLAADKRRSDPYRHITVGNVMVRRDVMEKARFDESVSKYGYDGILFGYSLEQNHIPVTHIDNAVVIKQCEDNAEFLHKTVESVENIAEIYDNMWEDQRFCQVVPLLKRYGRVRRMGMQGMVYTIFKMFKNPMESHFVRGNGISMGQFKFYKLGLLIKQIHYNN